MIDHLPQAVVMNLLLAFPVVAMAGESVVTSGPVKFTVAVGSQRAFIAQPIEFRLQVDAPQGATVQLPEVSGTLGPFEVRNFHTVAEIPVDGMADVKRWLGSGSFESLKTGELVLPPLEVQVRIKPGDSSTITLRSKPINVSIASLLDDQADATAFRDIKDAIDVVVPPERRPAWPWWIAGGIATFVGGGAAVVHFVRKRRGISAAQWALVEIERVEQDDDAKRKDPIECHQRLADILTEYLKLRFATDFAGSLNAETLDSNNGRLPNVSPELQLEINEFLQISEQVKFACLTVSPEDVRHAIGQIRKLVERCQQVDSAQRMEPA